ncbi:MAG: sugar ABC transporter substrate-binding protein, partial [Oscillospiraceae bacterium]|nr:sugar ABC transporter substrate-binding protein [Oscillospiraceae bacterium]
MRKLFALLLALAMVFALAACGAKTEAPTPPAGQTEQASQPADSGLIKVGIINLDPAESGYRQANVKDLTDTFTKENGYDATFVTAPTADKQLEAAKGFITAQVKYILVSAAETTGWDEVLE